MTLTKIFYISAVLLLFPFVLSAQEKAENTNDTSTTIIEDLHIATATDLLVEDVNGEVALSQEYYDASAIPDRVARIIKESLLEDTLLAEQTAKAFETSKNLGTFNEDEMGSLEASQDYVGPAVSFLSGGGL